MQDCISELCVSVLQRALERDVVIQPYLLRVAAGAAVHSQEHGGFQAGMRVDTS